METKATCSKYNSRLYFPQYKTNGFNIFIYRCNKQQIQQIKGKEHVMKKKSSHGKNNTLVTPIAWNSNNTKEHRLTNTNIIKENLDILSLILSSCSAIIIPNKKTGIRPINHGVYGAHSRLYKKEDRKEDKKSAIIAMMGYHRVMILRYL